MDICEMIIPKSFFVYPEYQFLVKFLKHNRFNTRTYKIKNGSFIVKEYLIYSSFKQNEQTSEQILQRKYDGE